jgi:hypothetical protein
LPDACSTVLKKMTSNRLGVTRPDAARDEVRSGRVKPIPADEVYRRIGKLLKK